MFKVLNMQKKIILPIFACLFFASCSSNKEFISNLDSSFDSWSDKEQLVKVFPAKSLDKSSLSWKPLVINKIARTYNFNSNDYTLSDADINDIKTQVDLVKSKNYKVIITGYADERGSREYNVSLGWKRAKAVAAYFGQFGINEQQIVIRSYGKEIPLTLGRSANAVAKNRRVEISYEEA